MFAWLQDLFSTVEKASSPIGFHSWEGSTDEYYLNDFQTPLCLIADRLSHETGTLVFCRFNKLANSADMRTCNGGTIARVEILGYGERARQAIVSTNLEKRFKTKFLEPLRSKGITVTFTSL